MKRQGIGQRELGRRLGYASNGVISAVLKKRICVPSDDIPKWADALGLSKSDRTDFINHYAELCIPLWYRAQLAQLQSEAVEHRVQLAHLRAKIFKISGKRL